MAQIQSQAPCLAITVQHARPAGKHSTRWPVFHKSTVTVVNNPSTINGQIVAVVSSAPNLNANSRSCR